MKTVSRIVLLLITAAISPATLAAAAADSVNYPVWVKRDAQLRALSPGQRLLAGDEINTGRYGRAWIKFDDGSVVKIGSNARFFIDKAEFDNSGDETLLDLAFDVITGAFRFTSGFFSPRRPAGHRVSLKVGAITAGIRGTDIWGRAADDEDFIALLEGSIEVASDGSAPQLMQQPLTLYRKADGLPADPLQTVDASVVQALAPETELDADAGIADGRGGYALVLMSLRADELVEANLARFDNAGYAVQARTAEVGGAVYTRILLDGLADRRAAENLRQRLAQEFAIDDIWISQGR